MRVLVTNDDGVGAPGIAALARATARLGHEVVVVAPLEDCSGAGAAVGAFYRRDGVEYEAVTIAGLEDVPVFGVDAPPALCVILACVGGFGPRPDIVLSGVNHGINVGRAALHSGTIGAALTGAHFGLRALAASIRFGPDPVPWDTPATLAALLVPTLAAAPASTVLNLNVPDVGLDALRGVRRAALGRGGTIRSVRHDGASGALPPLPGGVLRLDLALPGTSEDDPEHPPSSAPDAERGGATVPDAAWIAAGYASLTALVGVGEAATSDVADLAAGYASEALVALPLRPSDADGEDKSDASSGFEELVAKEIPS